MRREQFLLLMNENYHNVLRVFFLAVFNIVNNIDVDETRQMIEQYKRENKDQINKGRNKKVFVKSIFGDFGTFVCVK